MRREIASLMNELAWLALLCSFIMLALGVGPAVASYPAIVGLAYLAVRQWIRDLNDRPKR